MSAALGSESYRVGDLVVDVGRQSVMGPAGEMRLPKLSFAVLLALVRRAPDFLSNDELGTLAWAGVIVSPETVTKRVNLLRDALGDDAANPRYIAGLRSRGYRVIAPVSRLPATELSPAAPTDAGAASPAATPVRFRRWIAATLVIGIAMTAAAVWWLAPGTRREHEPTPAVDALATGATVAVLSFENLSASAADEYLAIGIPQMVLDRLSTVPRLTVIAGGSSFGIDARVLGPRETGRRLGARYLVEGSTQREGDLLRVTARLVDAQTAMQVWSTHVDRTIDDLFAVQDTIAAQVADELRRRSLAAALPSWPQRREPPIEAQLAYLQGRTLLARHTIVDAQAAVQRFSRAIEVDTEYAAALAGLFDAQMLAAERRHADLAVELSRHQPLIERALAIDPECGSAYVARALWVPGDVARQEADFRRGLELDPSNGRGLVAYSEFLDRQDRGEEATHMLDRALVVDPRSPRVHFRRVMRDFGTVDALAVEAGMKRVLQIDPDYQPALQRYAKYRWMLHGDLIQAAQIIEHAIEVDPENPWSRHTAAAIYLDLGDPATAREMAGKTPGSRASSQLLLALYAGDWRTAGESAFSKAGQQFNLHESWGAPEAARDFGLRSGDYARAIRFLEGRYRLATNGPLRIENFRAAACLAQLLQASGESRRAARLLAELPAAIDASLPLYGAVMALRTKATVHALTGDRTAALATLAASFEADDLMQWWYTLEHDPTWVPMHNDPVFRALAEEVRARVAREQAALAESRRSAARVMNPNSMDRER